MSSLVEFFVYDSLRFDLNVILCEPTIKHLITACKLFNYNLYNFYIFLFDFNFSANEQLNISGTSIVLNKNGARILSDAHLLYFQSKNEKCSER